MEISMSRCEEDSPDRCQARTGVGQCPTRAMINTKYCAIHGGVAASRLLEEKSISNYKLAVWQTRLKAMRDSPAIKSLRDEAAILRITLESIMNKCADEQDLILHSGRIADMVSRIEKLVTSCHKLEESLDQTLDKHAILQFADGVVAIIAKNVAPDKLDSIAAEIYALLEPKTEIK